MYRYSISYNCLIDVLVNQDIFLVWQDDPKKYTDSNFLNFSIRSEEHSCSFVYITKQGVNATHFILFTKYYLVSISPVY